MIRKLKIGDEVMWSHRWGTGRWKKARVRKIEKCAENVDEVSWAKMTDRSIILYLNNGFWAYGEQVIPIWDNSWTKAKNAIELKEMTKTCTTL